MCPNYIFLCGIIEEWNFLKHNSLSLLVRPRLFFARITVLYNNQKQIQPCRYTWPYQPHSPSSASQAAAHYTHDTLRLKHAAHSSTVVIALQHIAATCSQPCQRRCAHANTNQGDKERLGCIFAYANTLTGKMCLNGS